MYKRYKLGEISREQFNTIRNITNKQVLKAKNSYFTRAFESSQHNLRQNWNLIKTLMGRKKSNNNQISLNINDETVTDPSVIAEQFNTFFSQVATNLDGNLAQPTTIASNSSTNESPTSFFLFPVSPIEVSTLI